MLCSLTDEIGDEDEYVLVRLVIFCIFHHALRRSSRLAVRRSTICAVAIRACELSLVYDVLDHLERLLHLRIATEYDMLVPGDVPKIWACAVDGLRKMCN